MLYLGIGSSVKDNKGKNRSRRRTEIWISKCSFPIFKMIYSFEQKNERVHYGNFLSELMFSVVLTDVNPIFDYHKYLKKIGFLNFLYVLDIVSILEARKIKKT